MKSDSVITNDVGYSLYGYTYTPLSPRFRIDGSNSDGSTQLSDFTWYRTKGKIHLTTGNNVFEIYTDAGSLVDSSESSTDSTNTEDYWGLFQIVDGDMEFDWIFVRKFTAVEPIVTVGAEQHPRTGYIIIG